MAKSGAITADAGGRGAASDLPKFAKQKDNNRFKGPNGHLLRLVQQKMETAGVHRLADPRRRPEDHHDHRLQEAAGRDQGGRDRPSPGLEEAAHRARLGPAGHRCGAGDVRRSRLPQEPAQLGDVRHAAGLDVQGVRPGRGARGRLQPQDQAERQLADRGRRQHASRTRATAAVSRSGRHARARHPEVHQHRVRRPHPAAGHRRGRHAGAGGPRHQPTGTSRSAPRRSATPPTQAGIPQSVTRQVRPGRRGDAARLRAGGSGRHGQRLRDDRRRRQEGRLVRHREGRGPERATLHEHEGETEQAIPEDVAGDAIAAMRKVVNSGAPAPAAAAGRSARRLARPARRPPAPTRTSTCRRRGSPAPRPSSPPR